MDDDDKVMDEGASEELALMAQETIDSQINATTVDDSPLRGQRVLDLYNQGVIQNARDCFHAALVLLYGDKLAHYGLAQRLARKSALLGEQRSWTVQAMAWDRWLLASGKAQRFGTQIIKQRGRWSLGPVDPQITDNERAFYGVPPLFVQEQRAQLLQNQEDKGS
jgi:hypothetical protein